MSERKLIRCDCNEPFHCVVFDYFKDDGDLLIYSQMRHYLPWWKRLRVAFNYITKRDQLNVDYVEAAIYDKEKIAELRDFLNVILKDKETFEFFEKFVDN